MAESRYTVTEADDFDSYALAFINRRPDDVAVATLAPLNTDISLPPINAWSYNNDFESFFKMAPAQNYTSSLEMGHAFITTEASDIIASGPAIKKLMMEPYSAGPMSLICHRIGKSIYIDEENFSKKELQNVDLVPMAFKQQHYTNFSYPSLTMYENLIWHSKDSADWSPGSSSVTGLELALKEYGPGTRMSNNEFPRMFDSFSYKIKPQDSLDGEAYLWEFHDMRIMVDVDLPIFGGGEFPSVSIRLSEETKPISVLTGIDVMLDQLMCHCKETIMVYHQKGVIKEYDVIVKDEIPYLKGSEFDPSKIKNITENMLSFLTKNMTQQGHTYWLFREKGSDEMKLYDLTSLCPGLAKNPDWNPFLTPVIMLLYKLAHHLMAETQTSRTQKVSNVAYGLLHAADVLLDGEAIPAYRACVHYLLAGLYLPQGPNNNRESDNEAQDRLLNGLDDVIIDGYSRLSSSIKISQLSTQSRGSECEMAENGPMQQMPGPVRMPHGGPGSCEQALEHCLQTLVALEKCRNDDNVDFPFQADGLDDIAALKSIKHRTNDTIYTLLRHATLCRAATAYAFSANQMLHVNRFDKSFRFARMGISICASVLSSQPTKRHAAVCNAFLPLFATTLLHAMAELSKDVCCRTLLDLNSYRDQQILKHVLDNVVLKEQYNYNQYFNFDLEEITYCDWSSRIETLLDRCCSLVASSSQYYNIIQFQSTKVAAVPADEIACRFAHVAIQLGKRAMENSAASANADMRDGMKIHQQERLEAAMLHTVASQRFHEKAIKMLNEVGGKTIRQTLAIVNVNYITCIKMIYKLKRVMEKVAPEKLIELVEQISTAYRQVFTNMDDDITTKNEGSVFTTCLLEYANTLVSYTHDIAGVPGLEIMYLRNNYMSSSQRACESVLQRASITQVQRSEATALLTYLFFQQICICENTVAQHPDDSTSAKTKTHVKEFIEILKAGNKHLETLLHPDLDPIAKKPCPLNPNNMYAIKHLLVPDTTKFELVRQTLRWNIVAVTNGGVIENFFSKDNQPAVLWEEMQAILKYMMLNNKSDRLKNAYRCVLLSLPKERKDQWDFIREALTKALTVLEEKENKSTK